MDKKVRTFIGICFIAIIIISIITILLNWNKAFTNEINVIYPDGCKETFRNRELITPECTNGRILEKEQADGVEEWGMENLQIQN